MNSSQLERLGALGTISQLGLKQLSRAFCTALTKESVSPGKQGASPRAFTESSLIPAHNCGPCFAPGKSSAALKLVSWVITIFFFSTNTRAPSSYSKACKPSACSENTPVPFFVAVCSTSNLEWLQGWSPLLLRGPELQPRELRATLSRATQGRPSVTGCFQEPTN